MTAVNGSSAKVSSTKTTTVANNLSSQSSSETGPVSVTMKGDVNGDGTVNSIDLEAFSRAYGSTEGAPNWNQNCDFNSDNIVDVLDLQELAENFGKSV
jgi:hypothetical protein